MTYSIKRDGQEVARLSCASIKYSIATNSIFTLYDEAGQLIGSVYLTTKGEWTVDAVLEGAEVVTSKGEYEQA